MMESSSIPMSSAPESEFQLQFFRVSAFCRYLKMTDVGEHEFHAPCRPQVAIALVEVASDIGHTSVVVVCGSLNKDSNAVRTIPFKCDLLEVCSVFVCGLFDGAFNVVFGHVGRPTILNHSPKARVQVWFRNTATFFDRKNDVFVESGECL